MTFQELLTDWKNISSRKSERQLKIWMICPTFSEKSSHRLLGKVFIEWEDFPEKVGHKQSKSQIFDRL